MWSNGERYREQNQVGNLRRRPQHGIQQVPPRLIEQLHVIDESDKENHSTDSMESEYDNPMTLMYEISRQVAQVI